MDNTEIEAFRVSNVTQETPRKDNLLTFQRFAEPMLEGSTIEGIANSDLPIRKSGFTDNGFISAVDAAFNNHCALAFGPGHIHLCLLQILGRVINEKPEEYRNKFVSFEGKETIKIRRDSFGPPGSPNDWANTIPEFEEKIGEFLNDEMRAPLMVGFSNTTEIESVCRGGALMSAFQSYFSYVVMTRCGIPKVRLFGTPDDWRKLREVGEQIADMIESEEPTGEWRQNLLAMLDEFVTAAEGNANTEWWRSFYRANSMSGGITINGHILTLFPILKRNYQWSFTRGRNITSFPSAIVSAPFIWDYLGTKYEMKFLTGMWGTTVLDEEYYTPALNMVVVNGLSKSALCQTNCVAKESEHIHTFAGLNELREHADGYRGDGGYCDECRCSLDIGRIIHCDNCGTDFCDKCIDKLGLI